MGTEYGTIAEIPVHFESKFLFYFDYILYLDAHS